MSHAGLEPGDERARYAKLRRHGEIGIISLDRPERLNAISTALLSDLLTVLNAAVRDEAFSVLILRGEGRAFCAGNDLKELDSLIRDPAAAMRFVQSLQDLTRTLVDCDKIVIAAAQGYAVGGGFEWLLNCDLVVAATDLVAYFPEMALGQFVTGGVTQLLPRAAGHVQAMELLLLGERQSALDLQRRNLVNRVVAPEQLNSSAMQLALRVAAGSRASVAALKRVMTQADRAALERALALEAQETIGAFSREDAATRARNHAVLCSSER